MISTRINPLDRFLARLLFITLPALFAGLLVGLPIAAFNLKVGLWAGLSVAAVIFCIGLEATEPERGEPRL